ncbi:hypothetical protein BGZ63DRAFT_406503 [Mariannaea sp. PMI_226]|nr:hypothetical protein BGZ63DRAFT_406503 [Mariannaea sp. PMI_226]
MSTPTPGGFSLFPSPNASKPPPVLRNGTPRPRRSESISRATETAVVSPESSQPPAAALVSPPSRNGNHSANGRHTPQPQTQPQARTFSPVHFDPPPPAAAASSSRSPQDELVQQPRPTAEVPGRTETAFSQANTLVRSPSVRSRSSIAKLPLYDDTQPMPSDQPVQVQSIFPTYNPDVPLNQQHYAPTQMSPTHIPRAVISRQTYYEGRTAQSPPYLSPLRSPNGASKWPSGQPQEAPIVPQTSTNEQLKNLWKVANGWPASQSEGRVYCMKLTQEKDAPVYTLSSASQPFYNLRLDPTSASAYVTLTRHDPTKAYKQPSNKGPTSSAGSIINDIVHRNSNASSSSSSSGKSGDKNWHEALATTLEEESRRHPPNDGLVALLMPTPAAKVAIEKAHDPASVMMAERECARLVWDADTANHFLVHPALATPFCVTIERSPAWSRVEYTLEHNESPQHIAKLTRDGTGGGWLELDTGIASKIESYYIVDVVVTALLLVAAADEKNVPAVAETFEPPPPLLLSAREERRLSKNSKREEKKRRKMESFELDIESQNESLGKNKSKADGDEKLPFLIRVVVKLCKGLFKLFIWVLTIAFKCLGGVGKLLYRCVGSKY